MKTRIEKDSLGEKAIPVDAYYGIQTARAVENFPVSGLSARPTYIEATVHIKKAAAVVNRDLGILDKKIAGAILQAADEVMEGRFREWFVVDIYQAGAGTSHNMNVNEVLANRAIEILGGSKGDYKLVHPNDHVNMSQSTNDVCPTAIRIGSLLEARLLLDALTELSRTLVQKAREFDPIVKSGRTHLMDAVPVRLGQEFGAYAVNVEKQRKAIERALEASRELGIGGTAAGTGLNAHPEYRKRMVSQLGKQLEIEFRMADDYFEAMQSLRPMVELSGAVRNCAQDISRIASDIRLLGSGPRTGLAEIQLPPVQPGSSIMPGKVNPSIAEMVNMVCYQVLGLDTAIVMCAQAGQLELNVMMPLVAYDLLHAISILARAVSQFSRKCVAGITANEERCRYFAENSTSIVTVLNPHIGYAAAAEIAKEYMATGRPIRDVVLEKGVLTKEQLDTVFDLRKMTEPGIHK
jgi:aspartate ammonia-lyase